MYINTFKYTPKDVSCQLCTEYVKKLGCTALRCPWLGACTLGIIFCSALKAIHIKLTHISSDFFKVFNELVISHADTPLS